MLMHLHLFAFICISCCAHGLMASGHRPPHCMLAICNLQILAASSASTALFPPPS
ncbi:hypothetical protein GcM1_c11o16 [Golovinomyces cichoracearum]|uniref:Effector protein n=1 Tax=Golovinomyces cichoracearum TaxID=62708 RepID=A0A420IAL3_9PEZI|nr:hypothetical protein GcM1_c11o16 [Golovinomyces cichoracearum]